MNGLLEESILFYEEVIEEEKYIILIGWPSVTIEFLESLSELMLKKITKQ
ncbi:hypothetical protein [Paenibacillus larvae]|nr:hypothetical protein [Paenibacillus larvae]MDT2193485.1 hypothetical protein [Paenibacillus larvae]MDT2238947.1 hypothetical protein [Paenibacillus larvae]MDT2248553.1 hypothetical protein [Paenibacillus larvae]MDT2257984.1 hypothetical protein [Paenibacillus larvae]